MADKKIRIGVLGASGYTGSDLIRLAARHPNIEIAALTANAQAGKSMNAVFPHFFMLDLPDLVTWEDVDWDSVDAVFCGLPHGTTQDVTKTIYAVNDRIKIIDMSADFRLRDTQTYGRWYGIEHRAPMLQKEAVYGLSEHYREKLKQARLIACPGCYPTAALMALIPCLTADTIFAGDLIIDAKSGTTGAGRAPKQNTLLSEAGEGLTPYGVAKHRHAPEIEQEVSKAAGIDVNVNFTPHLIPMARGELCTIYARLKAGRTLADVRAALALAYESEPFVHLADESVIPQTQMVRGSNHCIVNVFEDRIDGRVIIISTIDNLVKGSSGQALQNFNLAFDLKETAGLEQLPLFP
ncbi:MAG: N-acetyl-gamma-glutamyl-phosphate reductase [Pseudomonadota bacterium]